MSKIIFRTGPLTLAVLVATALIATSAHATTLEDVKNKDFIDCGVSKNTLGFSSVGEDGKWTGLNVDLCRAMAAAVLGDAKKVKYSPLSSKERFTVLQSGDVDLLSDGSTWTLARDTALGLNFAGVSFYDGQGFLVRKNLGLKSAKELDGATVCVTIGTTTDRNLADFFKENKLTYRANKFGSSSEAAAAYDNGDCDAFTNDRSVLASRRLNLKNPDDHAVLPDAISKEPLGPVVRHGDDQWLDLVRWVLLATLAAEENGVTSENVDEMKKTNSPTIRRLLGLEGNLGQGLGVDDAWAYRIIKQVGNYAESYEFHVGPNSPLKLSRGVNRLAKHGGYHYPMPVR